MAGPVLVSQSTAGETSETTSHAVTLPPTVNRFNRLVAFVSHRPASDPGAATFSWPAGWTELIDTYQDQETACSVAWRIADGTEGGGTVTVTSTKTAKVSHKSFCFSRAGTVYASASASVYGSAPNPPSYDPGQGSANYHWLFLTTTQGNKDVTTYPTGYTSTGNFKPPTGAAVDNMTISWGRKVSAASSEDPGALTYSAAGYNFGITVGVIEGEVPAGQTFSHFASGTGQVSGGFDANHSVPMPAGVLTGKLLVITAISANTAGTVADISGWTRFTPNATRKTHMFGKIGTASESTTTVDWTVNDTSGAWCTAIDSNTGWPDIASVLVQTDTDDAIGAGGTITHQAYTAHSSGGNCVLRVGSKAYDLTGITITNFDATDGWEACGQASGPANTSGMVLSGEVRATATTASESVASSSRTINTWSASKDYRNSFTAEFKPVSASTSAIRAIIARIKRVRSSVLERM